MWFLEGTCYLPAFLVIWSSSTFLITYIIAIFQRDVDVIFPYISDTGARPPESGIFGLMTTVTAFTGLATLFVRYKYVQKLTDTMSRSRSRLNSTAFCFGVGSCVGICFVATFQDIVVPGVHDFGALLFFICGVTYIVLQTVLSYCLYPYGSSLVTCHVRTLISTVAFLASFPMIVCALLVPSTKLHWDKHDKDYIFHLVSAVCEWTVAFGFVFFFFTYIREFKVTHVSNLFLDYLPFSF